MIFAAKGLPELILLRLYNDSVTVEFATVDVDSSILFPLGELTRIAVAIIFWAPDFIVFLSEAK